jgi:hypothetical protein
MRGKRGKTMRENKKGEEGNFLGRFKFFIQHCFICSPSLCRRMLGFEPRIVTTFALASVANTLKNFSANPVLEFLNNLWGYGG